MLSCDSRKALVCIPDAAEVAWPDTWRHLPTCAQATPQGPPVQQDAAEASAEAASPQAVGDGGGEDEAQTQAAGEGGTEGENKKNKKKKK